MVHRFEMEVSDARFQFDELSFGFWVRFDCRDWFCPWGAARKQALKNIAGIIIGAERGFSLLHLNCKPASFAVG